MVYFAEDLQFNRCPLIRIHILLRTIRIRVDTPWRGPGELKPSLPLSAHISKNTMKTDRKEGLQKTIRKFFGNSVFRVKIYHMGPLHKCGAHKIRVRLNEFLTFWWYPQPEEVPFLTLVQILGGPPRPLKCHRGSRLDRGHPSNWPLDNCICIGEMGSL